MELLQTHSRSNYRTQCLSTRVSTGHYVNLRSYLAHFKTQTSKSYSWGWSFNVFNVLTTK
ncbi:hypothetical protein BpHYR1_043473 [Brachionus plicatilis]|uniref:Uncharacterized protein n=1 Tax=Brachionus plicatilis TaxID=10195 RepID=A0A3M7QM11_BRAPC|nr:hypothetical protein BpHYR1_043473 [Brachionus plicatilis]